MTEFLIKKSMISKAIQWRGDNSKQMREFIEDNHLQNRLAVMDGHGSYATLYYNLNEAQEIQVAPTKWIITDGEGSLLVEYDEHVQKDYLRVADLDESLLRDR